MDDLAKVQGNLKNIYNENELVSSLKDYLDIALLKKLQSKSTSSIPDKTFCTNQEFWFHSIQNKLIAGQIITIENFKVLEWVPSSPGLFHTSHARCLRQEAIENHHTWKSRSDANFRAHFKIPKINEVIELRPNEKMGMIQGGYGSLRIAPKIISNEVQHIICASSTGVSHEGIPIVVKQVQYEKIIEQIQDGKIPTVTIIGRLMILPPDLTPIKLSYHGEIPKFYLDVQDFKIIKNDPPTSAIVSVAVTYAKRSDYLKSSSFSYSFCSFSPTKNNGDLRQAVVWLKDYAARYSNEQEPVIIGDFDEMYNHFENVEFPIKEIAQGRIPLDKLKYYKELFNLNINELYMGDKIQVGSIKNNSGQIVIGKDIVISTSSDERKLIASKIDELIRLIRQENISDDDKQSLITNFDKVKEEITEEVIPATTKITKWLTNTKNVLENIVLANHTREVILWIYENFHFLTHKI